MSSLFIIGDRATNLDLWLLAGRDLYRVTPAVTRGLGFSCLIRKMSPPTRHKGMWRIYSKPDPHDQFSRLLRHTMRCGGPILTQILTGHSDLKIRHHKVFHICFILKFYWTQMLIAIAQLNFLTNRLASLPSPSSTSYIHIAAFSYHLHVVFISLDSFDTREFVVQSVRHVHQSRWFSGRTRDREVVSLNPALAYHVKLTT
jgi:hypothetical protein